MLPLDLKRIAYFSLKYVEGDRSCQYYRRWLQQDFCWSIAASPTEESLVSLLRHCYHNVPYYRQLFDAESVMLSEIDRDPFVALQALPFLTKEIIRARSDELTSRDLGKRTWFYNTSGGSTGEPVRFIQDQEYASKSQALKLLYAHRIGKLPCESELRIWGSERDIFQGTASIRSRLGNALTRTSYVNAFRMTPEVMRDAIERINAQRPKLIVAYAQAMYELATFAQRENLRVVPQRAIMTSAGTLYNFMRTKISEVFGCPVYNRYGSREVGDIACERLDADGLFVAPWGTFVEIIDERGNPVPPGVEGEIVVTSLINFAMPLLRYRIGDRGSFLEPSPYSTTGQVLKSVSGRVVDSFITRDGTIVDGEYFTHLMYFRPWVLKFQVVQETVDEIVFRVVPTDVEAPLAELDEIISKTHLVMGDRVKVTFNFMNDISPADSGKYRYTISKVSRHP